MSRKNKNDNVDNKYDTLILFMLIGTIIIGIFLFKISSLVAVKGLALIISVF